jgi:hypothetical protein
VEIRRNMATSQKTLRRKKFGKSRLRAKVSPAKYISKCFLKGVGSVVNLGGVGLDVSDFVREIPGFGADHELLRQDWVQVICVEVPETLTEKTKAKIIKFKR